jgi:hypothetical protein
VDAKALIHIYDKHEHELEQVKPHQSFRIVAAQALRTRIDLPWREPHERTNGTDHEVTVEPARLRRRFDLERSRKHDEPLEIIDKRHNDRVDLQTKALRE